MIYDCFKIVGNNKVAIHKIIQTATILKIQILCKGSKEVVYGINIFLKKII